MVAEVCPRTEISRNFQFYDVIIMTMFAFVWGGARDNLPTENGLAPLRQVLINDDNFGDQQQN